jgi:hypothetical protein
MFHKAFLAWFCCSRASQSVRDFVCCILISSYQLLFYKTWKVYYRFPSYFLSLYKIESIANFTGSGRTSKSSRGKAVATSVHRGKIPIQNSLDRTNPRGEGSDRRRWRRRGIRWRPSSTPASSTPPRRWCVTPAPSPPHSKSLGFCPRISGSVSRGASARTARRWLGGWATERAASRG